MTNQFTRTSEGDIPHLYAHGMHFPIAVVVENTHRLPKPKLERRSGYGLYVLPCGGEATANTIRARLHR